jgi:hypothetical protein
LYETNELQFNSSENQFYKYTPYFREGNPVGFTFELSPSSTPCTSVAVIGLYTCDLSLCDWDNLTNGQQDFSIDTGSPLFTDASFTENANCGCYGNVSGDWLLYADASELNCSTDLQVDNSGNITVTLLLTIRSLQFSWTIFRF